MNTDHAATRPARPRWISGATKDSTAPAPVLVRAFTLDAAPSRAVLELAVAGWHEVRVNGVRCGEDVLSPVTCQPDKRLSSVRHDVTALLRPGENTVEVLLGNGWFNCFTQEVWGFATAPWIKSPMIRGELVADGATLFVTDAAWRVFDSPITFNALRGGESYDARQEGLRANERPATVEKYTPAATVSPADAVPCRAFDPLPARRVLAAPDGAAIYDFGSNRAGWCELEVVGEAGARVTLDYDESLGSDGNLRGHILGLVRDKRPTQHDEYTLAGRPEGEKWHPRFTYHGFRYVRVAVEGKAEVKGLTSFFVHTAFEEAGRIETSDASFARLQDATLRSYLSNFVGIPTDCPHREKNGWTGDTQLAMETGLWNFDGRASYRHYLRIMLDAQRPDGAVPCILPCNDKFGFYWGSGPAWDAILFEVPWQIYRFYGDDSAAREAYAAMKRYVDFIDAKADDEGLVDYGLGDWCPPKGTPVAPTRLTDSAFVWMFNRRLAFWADRFGEPWLARQRRARADELRAALNRAFYKGDGLYGDGGLTSLACPLFFEGLCADGAEDAVFARLLEAVRAGGHTARFGIFGAKWVPRVLSRRGYVDDAWKIFTQTAEPGYQHWFANGEDTLWETWNGDCSHNHIMFGDLSAWAFEYVAGIGIAAPGFRKITLHPHLPEGVDSFTATHRTPCGEIRVSLRRENGRTVVETALPEGVAVADGAPAPRRQILLLGDSIRLGYCGPVRKAMDDRADVYFPEGNCMFAQYTLRLLYDWRNIVPDPEKIDVVHWNNGLWDLGQRDNREPLTPKDVYVDTLVRIHGELRRYFPNAKIVFATTTPVNTAVECEQHTLGNAVVEEYNAAAVAALRPLGVEIDDLYAFVRDHAAGHYADIVHYTPEGYRLLAGEVVRCLDRVLA